MPDLFLLAAAGLSVADLNHVQRVLAVIDSGAPVSAARRLVLCGLAVLVVMVVVVAVLGDAHGCCGGAAQIAK